MTYSAIAKVIGVHPTKVPSIERRAIAKLRRAFSIELLEYGRGNIIPMPDVDGRGRPKLTTPLDELTAKQRENRLYYERKKNRQHAA